MYSECLRINHEASVAEAQSGNNVRKVVGARSHRDGNVVMILVIIRGKKKGIAEGML